MTEPPSADELAGEGAILALRSELRERAAAQARAQGELADARSQLQATVANQERLSAIHDELQAELEASQGQLLAWITRQIPLMPPKAYRWIGEMEEIASTFGSADLPDGFHLLRVDLPDALLHALEVLIHELALHAADELFESLACRTREEVVLAQALDAAGIVPGQLVEVLLFAAQHLIEHVLEFGSIRAARGAGWRPALSSRSDFGSLLRPGVW